MQPVWLPPGFKRLNRITLKIHELTMQVKRWNNMPVRDEEDKPTFRSTLT
jgi:hypothetical protein